MAPPKILSPLKTIGVLLRDESQPFPVTRLREIFNGVGVQMAILDQDPTPDDMDLVIAMGGDGTVLRALDRYPACPVLAVNFGTVGFLTAGDRADLERMLFRLLSGDYLISERLVLRCAYPGGQAHAVNEVVVRTNTRLISLDVFVNESRIRTIRGDGVIVGTPTGSTGYLLSTGAPVVMPNVHCFVMDGINEYNFSSRPLVLSPDVTIRIRLEGVAPEQEVRLLVDGQTQHTMLAGEELLLTRSERRTRLIFFDTNYFFHNLTSRLSWH